MKDRHFKLLRWAPVFASAVLMGMVALVSVKTVSGLKKATYWREHTFKVILDAQALEDKLLDAQRGVDGYVSTGTPNLLLEYKTDTNVEARELTELSTLTRDNPEQQQRLKNLSAAVKAVFDYDNRLVAIYGQNRPKTAAPAVNGDQEQQVLDPALKDVEQFKDAEEGLLEKRDVAEQSDYHQAARSLIAASIVAAALLVFSNFIAGREMTRRRNAESKQGELIDELQHSLAEVKTLSGLIPICGWCKNVRSDTGYWQSVEHYVRAKTDATFTHGMCPDCEKKWQADLTRVMASQPAANASPQLQSRSL